jgi:D-sedoheptulose 7-phosphate isomerase
MTGVESLYPFLYSEEDQDRQTDVVLAEVARSTREKVAEIDRLRGTVAEAEAARLAECAMAMARRFTSGGRLFSFGNGGSSTDAGAVAGLFLGTAGRLGGRQPAEPAGWEEHSRRGGEDTAPGAGARPLPAMSLTDDVATLTALANDVSFEVVFARPLAASGRPADIALGLSTSGGSRNVLRAFTEAHRLGMLTVGLAGYSGGAMAEAADRGEIDYLFVMPSQSVHRIQEAQTTTYHVLWELTQRALADSP